MSVLLHTGAEHPNLLWIGIVAIFTFITGAGAGIYFLRQKLQAASGVESADA